jgi:hypothetical protein
MGRYSTRHFRILRGGLLRERFVLLETPEAFQDPTGRYPTEGRTPEALNHPTGRFASYEGRFLRGGTEEA